MKQLVLIGALLGSAAGACGATDDDRPRTLEYITRTVLVPNCAVAECHSAFKMEVGDQFDTTEATRRSIVANVLVDTVEPTQSVIYKSITVGEPSLLDPASRQVIRMPFDAPMPDADVALILHWIEDGAPGAQCLPNAQGEGCFVDGTPTARVYHVAQCVDGNAVKIVKDCPLGDRTTTPPKPQSICSIATGNGQCTGQ